MRQSRPLFFVIAILVVLSGSALACSILGPFVWIEAEIDTSILQSRQKTCLDKACVFVLEDRVLKKNEDSTAPEMPFAANIRGNGIRIESLALPQGVRQSTFNRDAFMEALDRLVTSDISDLKPIFFQEVEVWAGHGSLSFIPYEESREKELWREKFNPLNCSYAEFKRAGGWLITRPASHNYCYWYKSAAGWCGMFVNLPLAGLAVLGFFYWGMRKRRRKKENIVAS